MGSQEGGSNSNGGAQIQNQGPISNPLARQGSLYGLTFDEVQNQLGDLGKPLSTMNLDELLMTVWTAEANNQESRGVDNGPIMQQLGHPASGPCLNQQSNGMLSMDLSKKTVDEVWQDIQQGQKRNCLDRKSTLGEMTLEDFLVKAGIVADSGPGKNNAGPARMAADQMGLPHHAQWNYQMQPNMLQVFMPGQPIPIGGSSIMDVGYSENQMTMSSSPLMGTLSDTQTPGRKRVGPDDIAEKSVERRQKRMIKNRESAARSRARKQAYTQELENKVSRLEEENERLKRLQELEKLLPSIPPPEPKCQLRRTSSGPV